MLQGERFEPSMISDAELVKRAQDGEASAAGELYDRHQPAIYRYIRLRVGQRELAEDLTGETFVRLVAALPDYEQGETPLRAWLYRVAHNLIVDHYRRQNGRETVPLFLVEGESERMNRTDTLVDKRLTIARLKEGLEEIDPVQREVVVLRFIMGLPLKEVAHTLDKSVAAVKSLQHRGLAALRVVLHQEVVA